MTDQEKTQLVRESLGFVRKAIKKAYADGDTSELKAAYYVITLLDGSDDGSTFGPSET